jgi:DNA uptake protein ComE-like DNA-binding protein
MPFARWSVSALASVLLLSACASEPDAPAEASEDTAPETVTETVTSPTLETVAKINLNTASLDEFKTVPEVGDRMAREFDEYRPYKSIQQFRQEMGKYVEADQIAGYEAYVFVPVSPNESDAETVAQLPGVDLDEATQLVDARPFESDDAFLAALEPMVTPEDLELARTYLVRE